MSIQNYFSFNVVTVPDPKDPKLTKINIQTGPHGLFSSGLMMNIVIGVDAKTIEALEGNHAPTPSPITVKALFDSGCTITSIDKSIIESLNLKIRGFTNTATANGFAQVTQHLVSINFPGTPLKGRLVHQVQAVNLAGQSFGALIGRDLMSTWMINYNGPAGYVSIAD